MIDIEKIEVSNCGDEHITNSYLVYDETKEAILIDPGYDSEKIINKINEKNVNLQYIVITHAHGDHIGVAKEISNQFNVKIIVHENDKDMILGKIENYSDMLGINIQKINEVDIITVVNNYVFNVGNLEYEIIHTPGHTSGCMCILERKSNSLFTGDTLFNDCYGRCDLITGDIHQMANSLKMLFDRFEDIMIYPGHDICINISKCKKRIRLLMAMKGISI